MNVSIHNLNAEASSGSARRPKVRPPLPESHADIALCDMADVCALVRMSTTWVHDQVRAGRFPQPLRYGPRCTRWTMASIRAWLIERAAQPQAEATAAVIAKAKKASDAALVKRSAARATAPAGR
jgi:predicted DNA-binding transcriptional regulator AlpA